MKKKRKQLLLFQKHNADPAPSLGTTYHHPAVDVVCVKRVGVNKYPAAANPPGRHELRRINQRMLPASPSGPSPTRAGSGGRSGRFFFQQQEASRHWQADQDLTDEAFVEYIRDNGADLTSLTCPWLRSRSTAQA